MTDVLRLIKAYCELACRESSSRNKDYQECFQECLEWGIRTVRENIRRFGLTNLSIDYEEEEGFEEDEEYYEETPTFFAQLSRDDEDEYSTLYHSVVDFSTTAFYHRVNAVLRKHGITTAVDVSFYDEVKEEMEEMSTQGTIEDAVKRVLRKRGWLST